MVLVSGEAGIGKTSLVRGSAITPTARDACLWGACDALFTPRPLGPFVDVAEAAGGDLADAVERGAVPVRGRRGGRRVLARAPADDPRARGRPRADEATLDVMRLLARRVDGLPALVIATYRDDGLARSHPLRIVLGEIARVAPSTGSGLRRSRATPSLSSPRRTARIADELYAKTAGNPFFVTEALAAADEEIPPTVRDAVLGRAARLSPGRGCCSTPSRWPAAGRAVVARRARERLLGCLEECIGSGIVVAGTRAVAFSHELARLAVEESIPVHRSLALHRAALAALESPPDGAPDPARLAHHAHATGDAASVLQFAPPPASRRRGWARTERPRSTTARRSVSRTSSPWRPELCCSAAGPLSCS